MPDKTLLLEEVNVLINGTVSSPHIDYYKHLDYVVKQAIAGDQVVYRMAIRNNILWQWESLKDPEKNYIDLLNDIIPGTVVRIKRDSKRVKERLRVTISRVTGSIRKKNRSGSEKQRNEILNGWTNLSILAGDIMNPGEMEEEIKRLEAKAADLMERLQTCNVAVEEWRKKYENLEGEKKKVFEELTAEILNSQDKKKISNLEAENEEIKKYIRKLEKEQRDDVNEIQKFTKEMTTLSKRQATRRVESLSSRAQKALWFSKQYGLELDALCFKDTEGNQYPLKIPSSNSTSPAPPNSPQQTPGSTPSTSSQTPPSTPSTSSQTPGPAPSTPPQAPGSPASTRSQAPGLMTPTLQQVPGSTHSTPTGTPGAAPPTPPQTPVAVPPANGSSCQATVTPLNGTPPLGNQTTTQCKRVQYDSLSDSEKERVEAVLFLMDKFAVGDPFVHELSMLINGMPRSYLIKQCRDNLNSSCTVKPTSGPEPGAQIFFKESLTSKLNSLVTTHLLQNNAVHFCFFLETNIK